MLKLKDLEILSCRADLDSLPEGKLLINTINAHSFNTAQTDELFAEALTKGDVLIPDGASIVKACGWLKAKSRPTQRVAGWDLFEHEMTRLNEKGGKCFFMGSSQKVLDLIVARGKEVYPNITIETYSPPYKPEFSEEDNRAIIEAINASDPDLLWIGMTAPKQEKWAWSHWNELDIHCHCGTIGAVFDFFAGTAKRAPLWWQEHSLEWLYRLIIEPKRMWRRYIIGNTKFIWNMLRQMFMACVVLFVFLSPVSCVDKHLELWEAIKEQESRITALEEECRLINSDIEKLHSLLNALEGREYVTEILPIADDGETGYALVFSSGRTVMIKDGRDGYSPRISAGKHTDGLYYWMLDGNWLLDENGCMISVQGASSPMPKIKVEGGSWLISYDGGISWMDLGTMAEVGYSGLFSGITIHDKYVQVTLNDDSGSVLTLPLYREDKTTIIVDMNGFGDYKSIQEAVDSAPRGSTVYIHDGEYKETVVVDKFIHLVGQSKSNTVLYQDIGDYSNAPLTITQGSVSNMTVKSLPPEDASSLRNYAYAIHLDKGFTSNPKYCKCEISNCNIVSYVNDAIGAGTNYDSEYDIHDNMIRVINPVKKGAMAFKCHNGQKQTSGSIIFKYNILMTDGADGKSCYDLLFHNGGISNTVSIDVLMIGNTLKYYRNTCPGIFRLNSYCFGNSVNEMNTL